MVDFFFLAALAPFLAQYAVFSSFRAMDGTVFFYILSAVIACFLILVYYKIRAWLSGDEGYLQKFYINTYPIVFNFDVLAGMLILEQPSVHWVSVLAAVILSYFCSKYRVKKYKDSLNNMMITVQRAEGDFQNSWVYHNKGTTIWCICYDKDGHGMLIRRVTENQKGSEGHVTLEVGAKKAKLFEWDGNRELLEKAGRRGKYQYSNPELEIPINASVLCEVVF